MEQIREGFQQKRTQERRKIGNLHMAGVGGGGGRDEECTGEAEKSMMENQIMELISCVATDRINWCWTFHLTEDLAVRPVHDLHETFQLLSPDLSFLISQQQGFLTCLQF